MNLQQEVKEIIANAKAAYHRREITAEQFCDATRIPMKDAFLEIYEHGEKYLAFADDIYVPAFAGEEQGQ